MKEKGFSGKVVVNGVDIAVEKNKEDFIYICRLESVPDDIKVRDFINLYARLFNIPTNEKKEVLKSKSIKPLKDKTFAELTKTQKFHVTLSLLEFKKKQVYLVDDICEGLEDIYALKLKERMDELKDNGALVIYLNTSIAEAEGLDEGIYEGDAWLYKVETLKNRREFFKKRKDRNQTGE